MVCQPDNSRRSQQGYFVAALMLALSLLIPFVAQAGVFKCVATNGEISFSQTPCPEEKKETPAKEDAPHDTAVVERDAEPADIAFASQLPRPTAPNPAAAEPAETQPEAEKLLDSPALRAKKLQADARDEENRLQCEDNINAQINSINSQMRSSDFSASLVDSLAMKRRALKERLDDC